MDSDVHIMSPESWPRPKAPVSNPWFWLVSSSLPEEDLEAPALWPWILPQSCDWNLTRNGWKERISYFPLEMWLVAGWVETLISSGMWGASLKNKETGFQKQFLSLETGKGTGKLNSTHSCLSGLRHECRNGPSHSFKEWPLSPAQILKRFFRLKGESTDETP